MLLDPLFDWFLSHQIPFIYLSTIVTLPSVLLYIAEIVTVLRHKQLHNSFYALFIARALADLLHTFNSYFGFKLPVAFGASLSGIYAFLPNWVLRLSIFVAIYSFQAINLATVFVSINRLSAVMTPLSHEKLWNVVLLPVAVLVIFVTPLLALVLTFEMSVTLVPTLKASSSSFRIGESAETNFAPLVSGIFSFVATISLLICLLLNFGTLAVYKRRRRLRRRSTLPIETETQRTQRKLGIYTLCTFAGHMTVSLLMIGMSVCAWLGFPIAVDSLYAQYACAMDWCTVVLSSWLLLWASSSFRQQLVADLMPKWVKKWLLTNSTITAANDNRIVAANGATIILVRPKNAKVVPTAGYS
ncbi:hypothetical protein niasHT_040175 [Heterodera trifolii]|uniref:G-protein coupled receptors family 1 profile domain-containing protein n=1 Tax=Heterodera trifolii TaxID=157864 RepID=A0ABD2ICF1_9BILA